MNHKPNGPYEKYFKRPIDLFCGLMAVIVFSWLYVILIILGTIFMRGNPFFIQKIGNRFLKFLLVGYGLPQDRAVSGTAAGLQCVQQYRCICLTELLLLPAAILGQGIGVLGLKPKACRKHYPNGIKEGTEATLP